MGAWMTVARKVNTKNETDVNFKRTKLYILIKLLFLFFVGDGLRLEQDPL